MAPRVQNGGSREPGVHRRGCYLGRQRGIGRFIDLDVRLPVTPAVHQTTQAALPEARVAYVDLDPSIWSDSSPQCVMSATRAYCPGHDPHVTWGHDPHVSVHPLWDAHHDNEDVLAIPRCLGCGRLLVRLHKLPPAAAK
jgi:S-adenosyl methyltransferase